MAGDKERADAPKDLGRPEDVITASNGVGRPVAQSFTLVVS